MSRMMRMKRMMKRVRDESGAGGVTLHVGFLFDFCEMKQAFTFPHRAGGRQPRLYVLTRRGACLGESLQA